MRNIMRLLSEKIDPEHIFINEPMKNHTSFKIGGPADLLVIPRNINEIVFALKALRDYGAQYYIVGKGSNILVKDNGYRGVIIKIRDNLAEIYTDETIIKCGAGALVEDVAKYAMEMSLSGLEFAEGIPGTVGGAVFMNAGAYDGEFKNVVHSVTVINKNGDIETIPRSELSFGYRTSSIQTGSQIVLDISLGLSPGDYGSIKEKMEENHAKREDKQPLEFPSAGSVFKRPEGFYAGKLIGDSGLKGFSIGGAAVSEKHAGFIVNTGDATASDVISLIEHIKKTVYGNSGVMLEPEIRIIGE